MAVTYVCSGHLVSAAAAGLLLAFAGAAMTSVCVRACVSVSVLWLGHSPYVRQRLKESCVCRDVCTLAAMQHTCTSPLLFYCRKNYRVLIYNGDVDACVPYLGNEVSGVGGVTQSQHCG